MVALIPAVATIEEESEDDFGNLVQIEAGIIHGEIVLESAAGTGSEVSREKPFALLFTRYNFPSRKKKNK